VDPFQTLVDFPEFRSGLVAGLFVSLPVLVIGLAWRLHRPRGMPLGLAGPAFSLAALATIGGWFGADELSPVPQDLVVGVLACWLAGTIAARTPRPVLLGGLLTVPGAVLIAGSEDFGGAQWVVWLIFVGTVLGGAFGADLDRRVARLGLGPVLFLIAVGGLYATVPDTEIARPLVGAALPLALCGWPLRAARLGAGGTAAAIGVFLWVAAFEGFGRPGSIVGAAGALALLLTEPVGRMLGRRRVPGAARTMPVGRVEVIVVGAQLVLSLYAARIAGFEEDGLPALVLLAPVVAVGVVLGAWLGLSSRLSPESRPRRARGSSSRRRPRSGSRPPATSN
jgi:hypothetical protein